MDELKMSIEEMISVLDGAAGRLIVASMENTTIKEAMEMVTNVSISLGEWVTDGLPQNRWIPVTERLPEEWTEVLVFARCRPDAEGFVQTAVYIGNPGYWRVTWNHCMLEYNIVTHWMPLPEPPEGGIEKA